jgi:hypothetical protein
MKASGFSAVVIWSGRLNEMVSFYKALGLPLETEEHEEGPVHYACELGSTHFAIFESKPGDAVHRGIGGSTMIGLQVSNVDEAYSIAKNSVLRQFGNLAICLGEEPPRFLTRMADPLNSTPPALSSVAELQSSSPKTSYFR